MDVLTIVRVVAIVCAGLKAGIFLGYRAGPQYALTKLSPSSFVQFQQVVHLHYVRFMPPLTLTALLTALAWLVMIRSRWASPEFWLIAASTCGIVLIAAMTRAVNVPINNRLMTWKIDEPPSDLRKMWAPWDRVNTIRAFVSTGVLILEAVALSLRASTGRL
jgi:uncharacterized membrane protein